MKVLATSISTVLVAVVFVHSIIVATTLALTPQPQKFSSTKTNHENYDPKQRTVQYRRNFLPLFSDWNDNSQDSSNQWKSSTDDVVYEEQQQQEDWEDVMKRKKDGSFWSDFEPTTTTSSSDTEGNDNNAKTTAKNNNAQVVVDDDQSEAWLETLASLQAEEVEFNLKEAERADKARQMQEWGFDMATIQSTLDIAVDTSLEEADEIDGMKAYRQESYWEEEDLSTVESHTKVPIEPDTGEPVRSQMVYVDEHTCIGCTNCAMIAQSTFFMNQEHGRARVFQQWGDDDETIQIAIMTCPVDCIHYVPYDELVRLEVDRRDQNINPKARLVSQAEYSGVGLSNKVGGAVAFTAPQQISGNMGARCNNCPSRGCATCPMFGVGKNPEFERKEKLRKERAAKRRLQQERDRDNKSADL